MARTFFYVYFWLGYCHLLLGHADEAIDFLRKGHAANPQLWGLHMLAAALGLKGDIDQAKADLAESIKLKPEVNSIAKLRAFPNINAANNPRFVALQEKTLFAGLRRAGVLEE
jgi:adenylate cyclase